MDPLNPMPGKDTLKQDPIVPEQEQKGTIGQLPEKENTELPPDDSKIEIPDETADEKVEPIAEPVPESETEVESEETEETQTEIQTEPVAETTEEVKSDAGQDEKAVSEDKPEDISSLSKPELCERLKVLIDSESILGVKNEVEVIKQTFYKKNKTGRISGSRWK